MSGRYALVIASDRFDDERLRALDAPRNDADALHEVLADPYVGAFDVDSLVDEPSGVVAEAVEAFFADRARDDLLLLYFSGHGLKDDQGRLYLAMSNTRPDRLASTALAAAFVREAMERARARQTVLLLDCCYSGAFAGAAKADPYVHTRDAFAASGCVVLTASDAIQYSFEEDGVHGEPTRSVFTHALVDGITSGAADRDHDGDISLDELYDYVHARIVAEHPQQRPGKWAWDLHGRLVIARNPCWSVPEHVVQAIESPYPAMRLGAVDELTHLLRTGNELVRATARSLLDSMSDDDSRSVAAAARSAVREAGAGAGEHDALLLSVVRPVAAVEPRTAESSVATMPMSSTTHTPKRHLRVVRPPGPHVRSGRAMPWVDAMGLLLVAGALSVIAVVLGLQQRAVPDPGPSDRPTAPTSAPTPTSPASTTSTPTPTDAPTPLPDPSHVSDSDASPVTHPVRRIDVSWSNGSLSDKSYVPLGSSESVTVDLGIPVTITRITVRAAPAGGRTITVRMDGSGICRVSATIPPEGDLTAVGLQCLVRARPITVHLAGDAQVTRLAADGRSVPVLRVEGFRT